jgi:hypothetical protein
MNNPTQSSKIDRNLSSTGNDNSSNNDIAGVVLLA